jgi:hypothetical protein
MHRIVVIIGVLLCIVAIGTYSLWPVEEEAAIVDQPAAN